MTIPSVAAVIITLTTLVLISNCSFGQSHFITYGANTDAIKLAFEDQYVSASCRTLIANDMQLCLSEWGRTSELRLRNEGVSVGYLYNSDQCPHYPEEVEFPKNVILDSANERALMVSKRLSDAYTNAFTFATANSNIIAAAYQFISFVSSTNFLQLPASELPNYLLEKKATSNEIIALAAKTKNDLAQQTYYSPSLLGFAYFNVGPESTNLWMRIPCSNPLVDNDLQWSAFPAIWHDNRWKFCIWDHAPGVP